MAVLSYAVRIFLRLSMSDIIDNGNEAAELFLKAALANREKCSLQPVGQCHYCGESVKPNALFCG